MARRARKAALRRKREGRPALECDLRPAARDRQRRQKPCGIHRRRKPAPWRHRPLALGQDGVHHRAGASSHAPRGRLRRRAAQDVSRVSRPCRRPPAARAPRAPARRPDPALRAGGAHRRADRRRSGAGGAPLAGIDAAHFGIARHDRIRARARLAQGRRPRSRSTSSIIPANGCSTCRCWRRITANGRARRSRRRARKRAR